MKKAIKKTVKVKRPKYVISMLDVDLSLIHICIQHPYIYIFLSSPANNLEVFFMFPQAKRKARG